MKTDVIEPTVAGVTGADLWSLIPVLAAAYAVVLGAVGMVTGWQLFRDRMPSRYRRGVQVPPQGATEQSPGNAP
ncbi:MAG: hypothetical protein ACRDSL_00420 [Pseudonocardiaceae bacterium]